MMLNSSHLSSIKMWSASMESQRSSQLTKELNLSMNYWPSSLTPITSTTSRPPHIICKGTVRWITPTKLSRTSSPNAHRKMEIGVITSTVQPMWHACQNLQACNTHLQNCWLGGNTTSHLTVITPNLTKTSSRNYMQIRSLTGSNQSAPTPSNSSNLHKIVKRNITMTPIRHSSPWRSVIPCSSIAAW